jgi:hypothetical protein
MLVSVAGVKLKFRTSTVVTIADVVVNVWAGVPVNPEAVAVAV